MRTNSKWRDPAIAIMVIAAISITVALGMHFWERVAIGSDVETVMAVKSPTCDEASSELMRKS